MSMLIDSSLESEQAAFNEIPIVDVGSLLDNSITLLCCFSAIPCRRDASSPRYLCLTYKTQTATQCGVSTVSTSATGTE
jgi:hypothetical protein